MKYYESKSEPTRKKVSLSLGKKRKKGEYASVYGQNKKEPVINIAIIGFPPVKSSLMSVLLLHYK